MAAITTIPISWASSDVNQFNTWGAVVSNLILSCGFIKTADTGQINFGTNTNYNQAGNTVLGYEIWQSGDNLTPFFFKLEYGTGLNYLYIGLWLTVGTGTDGAGNITGNTTTRQFLHDGSATVTCPGYACGDGGRLAIGLANRDGTAGLSFGITRTRDTNLVATGDGVQVLTWFINQAPKAQYVPMQPNSPVFPQQPLVPALSAVPSAITGSYGGNLGVFPIFPFRGYADNPDGSHILYFNPDIPPVSTVSVFIGGASHNYIALGYASGLGQGAGGLLMRLD